ncbi:hypothetical protein Cantr_08353 [Candida viswanathii]|uniref:Peptidase n=1 Tax=Candida viswanathii TaxID=5486 RepID=A0A367Y489_9ASCO|nr:hypothetical protein Cantr_08353 [Candida viswanathii]
MCGRFALGIALDELPNEFNRTVLLDNANATEDVSEPSERTYDYEIHGSENDMRVQLDLTRVRDWNPSYNIAPTNSALIITMAEAPEGFNHKYVVEPLKFGLVPLWAKPTDPTPVRKGKETEGAKYSQEIGKNQAKYFNCRRESLDQARSVWNSCKNHRCVVPIQGYFEWKKDKIKTPYFVHSKTEPLCFLVGFYSHNFNYTENRNVRDEYLSTFTIITAPAAKDDEYDLSWLHSRKPMMIEPGSQAWFDWLDPDKPWSHSLISDVLNSSSNKAYADIEAYKVTKDVGNPSNNGESMIANTETKKQSSIGLFFLPQKKKDKDGDSNDALEEEPVLKQEKSAGLKEEDTSPRKRLKTEHESSTPKKLKKEE